MYCLPSECAWRLSQNGGVSARKMEHKQPVQISGKTILTIIVGVVGALVLGVGMCFYIVWGKMVIGVMIGIIVLFSLIPLIKGIKD